jgi:hypothetical protein
LSLILAGKAAQERGSMTTVLTRLHEIKSREGFDIWNIRQHGRIVKVTKNGILVAWPHRNRTRDSHTVKDFREKFFVANPGCTCDVLEGNGAVAHGNKLLKQVRATY